MAMSKYPSMNWDALDVADTFKLYKQRLLLVCEDNDVTENERIARKFKIGVGDEVLRRLNASGLSDIEQKNPAKLWSLFETQLKVAVNFRIHRLCLMQYRQKESESLDEFVTRARTQAHMCEFEDKEMQERTCNRRNKHRGLPKGATVVPALGDPRRERPPAVYGHFVNVPTRFNVKLPLINGHLPHADADSHLLVVSTCYNGQCRQMPRFRWSLQPKIAGAHPNLGPTVRTNFRAVVWWPTSNNIMSRHRD